MAGAEGSGFGLGLRRITANVAGTLAARIVQTLAGLGLAILIARALGPSGNGLYAVAVLVPTTLATLLQLGVGPGTIYHVGRGVVGPLHARATLLHVWGWVSTVGLAVAAGVAFAVPVTEVVPAKLLWPGLLFFPVVLLQLLLANLLQAVEDFRGYNVAQLVPPLLTLVAAGFAVIVLDLGVVGAVWAFGVGQAGGLAVNWWFVRGHTRAGTAAQAPPHYRRELLSYGWKAHASNVMSFLSYRADILLVTWLSGAAAAGLYVVAVQLAERLWLLSQTTSVVVFPRLAQLEGDERTRNELTPVVSRWVFAATLLGAAVLALVARPAIGLLFGREFLSATKALYILLPGVVALGVSRILANDIAARGRPEINMYLALGALVANIVANLILIPVWGIAGAAAATTISYSLNTAAKVVVQTRLADAGWWQLFVFDRRDWTMLQRVAQKNGRGT